MTIKIKNPQKAVADKVRHLQSGRDSAIPVQDKTKIKDNPAELPSTPNMKTPRMTPIMQKSGEESCKENGSLARDLFKAFDQWKLKEESFKNKNHLTKSSHSLPLMKPFKSDAQRRAMYAAAKGHSTIGIPKEVGKEFVSSSHDQDQSKLPEKVKKTSRMCKNSSAIPSLYCLCEECRHDEEVMSQLQMMCLCDRCCTVPREEIGCDDDEEARARAFMEWFH
jgi:hypothetical protein